MAGVSKKRVVTWIVVIAMVILAASFGFSGTRRAIPETNIEISGSWHTQFENRPVQLHITPRLRATLQLPGPQKVRVPEFIVEPDGLRFAVPQLGLRFAGSFTEEAIEGRFTWNQVSESVTFQRQEEERR